MPLWLPLLIAASLGLPTAVLALQLKRGLFFSVIAFQSLVYLSEHGLAAVLLLFDIDLPYKSTLALESTGVALGVSFTGYVVMMVGYYGWNAATLRSRARKPAVPQGADSRPAPLLTGLLLAGLAVTTLAGIVSPMVKANAVGGYDYLATGYYRYRFGNFAASNGDNALVSLFSILSALGRGFLAMAVYRLYSRRRRSCVQGLMLGCATLIYAASQALSAIRATLLGIGLALLGVFYSLRRPPARKLIAWIVVLGCLAVVLTYAHFYLFFLTAGWHQMTFSESALTLVASSKSLVNLSAIVATLQNGTSPLYGQGLLENFLFFIPRSVWAGKSDNYSSIQVAKWAGLPDAYQVAVTQVGELIARFGWWGILGMALYGVLASITDRALVSGGVETRIGIYSMVLPRAWSDGLMGLSSITLTVVEFVALMATLRMLRAIASTLRRDPERRVPATVVWRPNSGREPDAVFQARYRSAPPPPAVHHERR